MASPSPRPPCVRVVALSACRKRSKTKGRKSGRMPLPVSLTTISARPSASPTRLSTPPPSGVNLMAFESRFQTTCCKRPPSPHTRRGAPPRIDLSRMPFACAAGRTATIAAAITSRRSTGPAFRRSLPAAMRETSVRSSTSRVSDATLRSIASSARGIFAASSLPFPSRRAHTTTALSGVRSSWERVIRNSPLMRSASRASR